MRGSEPRLKNTKRGLLRAQRLRRAKLFAMLKKAPCTRLQPQALALFPICIHSSYIRPVHTCIGLSGLLQARYV